MGIGKVVIGYFDKMAVVKDGGLTILSGMISIPFSISLDRLLEEVDYKRMVILILSQGIFLFLYSIFNTIDLFSGLRASKHQCVLQKGRDVRFSEYWDKDKFLDTIWKYLAVVLLTGLIMFFAYMSEIYKLTYLYYAFVWFQNLIWLMANGYEFSSIGDNIEKRNGKKPRIFSFFEILLDKVSKKAIDKIDKTSFDKMD